MFTVLWKIGPDHEEIYSTYGLTRVPAAPEEYRASDQLDCGGRAHVAFQKLTAVEGDPHNLHLCRTVIDTGDVFVMNGDGKTVATYRFGLNPVDVVMSRRAA